MSKGESGLFIQNIFDCFMLQTRLPSTKFWLFLFKGIVDEKNGFLFLFMWTIPFIQQLYNSSVRNIEPLDGFANKVNSDKLEV